MARDRLRPLLEIIAQGDPAKVRQEGERLRDEFDADIKKLRRDRTMIDDLLTRYGGAKDVMTPAERSARVRDAALALVKAGNEEITPQNVIDHLAAQDITFSVARPHSMVGTVLFQASDLFEKLGQNQFRYRGPQPPPDSAEREPGRGSETAGDDDEGGED